MKNKDLLLIPGYDPYSGIIYCEPEDIDKYSKDEQRNCFFYDSEAGDYIVDFIEDYCTHVHGSMAGSKFLLEDWQKCIVRNLFGWKSSVSIDVVRDGEMKKLFPRRYGTLFLYIPRKNGKSIFTGALTLAVMLCDNEPGAQMYTAATTEDQAAIIFNVVKKMVQNDDLEDEECMSDKIEIRSKVIYLKDDPLTVFMPLSGSLKGKHGLNCHFLGIDELHEHDDDKIIEPLETSMGARDQPLVSYMTTADYNRKSPCNELHQYAKDVRDGLKPDATFLPVVYEVGKDEDWTDPKVWAKANPNLGISVKEAFLYKECQKAQNLPSLQNRFKRLYLNIKTDSDTVWMSKELWATCDGRIVDIEEYRGHKCYLGTDIASTQDLSATAAFFPDLDLILMKFWLPEERKLMYNESGWVRDEYITLTPGSVFDTEIAEDYVRELASDCNVVSVAYDEWNALQYGMHLVDDGFDMVKFRQTAKNFNAPLIELEKRILSGKINHQGNPVLAWMVQNCVVTEDTGGYRKLDKKKSKNKIDGVVAVAMAIGAFLMDGGDKDSVYEDRGIIFF